MYNLPDTKMKIFTNIIAKEPVKVIIQTTTNRIEGSIHIRPEERIKDELNQSDLFLAVTDAAVFDQNNLVIFQTAFLVLNREQITWITPEDELKH